ncbi:molecular chaperone [Asaia bogorensis]|uniref:fimbrial biogenesis chaperone n=1 Tax=Asaia bogorensis TaxID=91915 RepID=UPI000EFADCB1|nr:molecular chaperone [Asaia bogorensis]
MVTPLRKACAFGLLALLLTRQAPAWGASSVTIWPVNPLLGRDVEASALWLENNDHKPVLLQIRVFRWTQDQGEDHYDDQTDIIASPPMSSVQPGTRQLIRLMRTGDKHADVETAYRVLIDEIPTPDAQQDTTRSASRIAIQLRYSIPLFVYGTRAADDAANPALSSDMKTKPILLAHLDHRNGRARLMIRNDGSIHARLSKVTLGHTSISAGLLGYILPGQEMAWPLPAGVSTGPLQALINDSRMIETIPLRL